MMRLLFLGTVLPLAPIFRLVTILMEVHRTTKHLHIELGLLAFQIICAIVLVLQ